MKDEDGVGDGEIKSVCASCQPSMTCEIWGLGRHPLPSAPRRRSWGAVSRSLGIPKSVPNKIVSQITLSISMSPRHLPTSAMVASLLCTRLPTVVLLQASRVWWTPRSNGEFGPKLERSSKFSQDCGTIFATEMCGFEMLRKCGRLEGLRIFANHPLSSPSFASNCAV